MTGTTRPIRWGILGTGNIAKLFATGLGSAPGAVLAAVGSRTQEKADEFGDRFGIPRRHADYAALAADPDLDVIYVATPHPLHHDATILCLEGGKAVLCEKPFALNAGQAAAMIDAARARGLFLMEAMWSRYYPAMARARELLAAGAIGEPRILQADLGFRARPNPQGRLFDPALGGGALLDIGVYPVSLASMVFGTPSDIASQATMGETGVDEQNAIVLRHPGGQLAVLSSAIRTVTPHEATIMGTEGVLRIGQDWHKPNRVGVTRSGQGEEIVSLPIEGNGYNYEAIGVMDCLRAGKRESAVMPLDETLAIVRTLDAIRAPWGLRYPGE
jgi:predicted dehydrogenase